MSTIATLVVKITGDATGFNQTAKGVKQSAAQIGKSATRAGLGLTAGLTLPIVGLGVKATSMASDLVESQNKVGVVFGDTQSIVRDFAKTSAENLGISEQAALEAAGTYGNLFTAMGLIPETSADMSVGLVELAADLASFNNLSPDEVLLKLQSGLTGMAVPLKSVGINLTAVNTRAKALELGLVDANGEVTEAGLLQARYAIILEQSTNAQGDFARTSEDLANASRIAKAQLANMTAEIGMQLLPIALKLVTGLKTLIDWFSNLSPGVKTAILIFLGLVAVIGPLLLIFGAIVSAVTTLIPLFAGIGTVIAFIFSPIGLLIAALIGLAIVIIVFGEDAVNTFNMIVEIVVAVVQRIMFEVTAFFQRLIAFWTEKWNSLVEFVKNIFNIDWGEIGMNIIQGIANGITNGIGFLVTSVSNAASTIVDGFNSFFENESPSKLMARQVGMPIGQGVGVGIDQALAKISPNMDAIMGSITPMAAQQQAAIPQGGAGGGNFEIVINNPVAEPASVSIPNALRKLAFLGKTS